MALLVAGTLLSFFPLKAPAKDDQRTLTFTERVTYQRAIEEVYWRHRIWPKENLNPKPSLDAVMSQVQLENKVKTICATRRHSKITGKSPSLPTNYRPRWTEWPGTRSSPRFCGNSLRRSGTIPLLSPSVWQGRRWLSAEQLRRSAESQLARCWQDPWSEGRKPKAATCRRLTIRFPQYRMRARMHR